MERCSFFNAELNGETYDRVYLAEDFARYFSSFIGNGVFSNPATGLQVVADNKSMNVIIKPGKAWINGYFYENTDDLILQVNVADGLLNRIDKVVLRLDFLNREIKAYVKQGNFASTPTSPALTRNADIYELALAEIKINKGIIKIDQALITDLRFNKELCGVVKGTIEEIDTTDLFVKFENGFNAWFEHMKGTIEGDTAANLTNEVYKLNNSKNQPNGIAILDENGEFFIENIPCKIKTIYEHSSGSSLELTNVPFHANMITEIQISALSDLYNHCVLKINGIEIFNEFEYGKAHPLFARILVDRVGNLLGGIVYNDGYSSGLSTLRSVKSLVFLPDISKKIPITSNNTIEFTGCYNEPSFKVIGYGR